MPPSLSIHISRRSRWWLFAIIRWILAMCEAELTVEEGSMTYWGGWVGVHSLPWCNVVILMVSTLIKTSHREKE